MQRVVMSLGVIGGLVLASFAPGKMLGEAPAPAGAAFDRYAGTVEARLAVEHRAGRLAGVAGTPEGESRMRRGERIIEPLRAPEVPGAMLHDWRGSAFAPGARAADFESLLRNFDAYPQVFAPQVLQARTLAADGDHVQGWMRVRQKHVITVVLDTTYDVQFARLDAGDGWSASRSTRVDEIADAGTSRERRLGPQEEHGFLWRIDTYWTWQERDGGLYLQVESVSLTRAIPAGLGWIVGPFVESVPRESLEFTLQAAVQALRVRSQEPGNGRRGTGQRSAVPGAER